jgi:ankyrin repeat protein
MAVSVLRWVSAAVRPLSLLQLHAAIAPDMSAAELRPEKKQQVEQEVRDWVSFCGHILVVDPSESEWDRTVNFVHQSAKDYLFQKSPENEGDPFLFQEAEVNFVVARRCTSYLQMALLEQLTEPWDSKQGVYRRYPLLEYSIRHWPDHAKLGGDNVCDLTDPFFAEHSRPRNLWLIAFEIWFRRGAKLDKIDLNDSASLIHIAARLGIRSLLLSLLNRFCSQLQREPGRREYLEQITENGNTPLQFAARYGHLEAVQILLDHGADINARDSSILTALLLAAWARHDNVVDLLLNKQAEIGFPSDDGFDLYLDHKVVDGYIKVLENLKSSGENFSNRIKAKNGTIPLSAAIQAGKKELAGLLLHYGADIETRNRIGNTPLAEAAYNADHILVKALLQRGANLEARNNDGETPLIASACLMPDLGRRDCINALLDNGADIDVGWSRTYCTISMEILRIYILNE